MTISVVSCWEVLPVKHWIFLCVVLMLAAGCSPENEESRLIELTPLPTRQLTATPAYNNIEDAQQTAANFLDAWQREDYPAMYTLLSVESQQTVPFETFKANYETARDEIRLTGFDYAMRAAAREGNRVITFTYDASLTSHIVGTFDDPARSLRLVIDDTLQAWRVAWTPATIFTEMENGGRLRMETFPPLRADIYDRNGRILADMNGRVALVNIIKRDIPDLETCLQTLAGALDEPLDSVRARVANYRFEQLAEVGSLEQSAFQTWQQPLERDCAATFDSQRVRRYINGDLTAHLIGYLGYPEESELDAVEWEGFRQDSIIGRSGVERSWNGTLAGKPGGRLTIVSPGGEQRRLLAEQGASPGEKVYLTIDAELQQFVLDTVRRRYASGFYPDSEGASVIVMNVNTGEVLAMVSYPTFDANAFNPYPVMGTQTAQTIIEDVTTDERQPQLNRSTQGGYPTGSVMKVMTAIAALDSGLYTQEERYTSIGVWNRDIPRVDWNRNGHGSVNLQQALMVSCNSCFYEAGYRMDQADPYLLPAYANRLGLGVPTGMQDIAESVGVIAGPDTKSLYAFEGERPWNFSDAVNLAIGQGFVEVTPLQMLRLYTAVANDGTLYRPQLVLQTGLVNDVTYELEPDPMHDIDVDSETLTYIHEGLCMVTTQNAGTAEFIFRNSPLQSVGICGKTGTAQSPGNGQSHAWFVGYGPRDAPEIAVLAMVENSGEGSEVAAPIVCEVLEYYYFGLEVNPVCPRY